MPSINLLTDQESSSKKPLLKKCTKWLSFIFIFAFIAFVVFTTNVLFSENSLAENLSKLQLFTEVKKIITEADTPLLGEVEGRINVLLLGIGGGEHDGTQLTDTMIIASILPQTNQVALISFPRDLIVPIPGYGWRKINHINALTEIRHPGEGAAKTAEIMSDLFHIPIHYYVRIDFEGFTKVIDEFGGIDVFVDNTLSDYRYPIRGRENAYPIESRFEHLYIQKGWHKMNGELALKYVRSRHAQGIEGSDFARSKRQQKVLSAFKKKVLSIGTIFSPQKLNALLFAYHGHVATDISVADGLKLIELIKPVEEQHIHRLVLDNSEEGPLKNSTITDQRGNRAYILQPKTGDFSYIQKMVHNIFDKNNKDVQLALALSEEAEIELQNGTLTTQLASSFSDFLKKQGYHVSRVGNANDQSYQNSVIYDFTNTRYTHTLSYLKSLFPNALIITSETLTNEMASTPTIDFLVILGEDAKHNTL